MNQGKWREGINLQAVPSLEHRIRPRQHGIQNRREIHRELVVQAGCKEIDGNGTTMLNLPKDLLAEGPLGPQHLVDTIEVVCHDVQRAGDKLREERHIPGFANPQDGL